MADYGSSGIWGRSDSGPFRSGEVAHEALGLPAELARDFDAWIKSCWMNYEASERFDRVVFNARGLALAQALKRHVGPEIEIVFVPEVEDGGRRVEQIVN